MNLESWGGVRVLGELKEVMMDDYDPYELYKFQIVKILTIVKDTNVNYSKSKLLRWKHISHANANDKNLG